MSATPRLSHQRVASRLHLSLASYVAAAELGKVFCTPVDVVLSTHDVVQPDILFLSSATLAAAVSANHRYLGLPPDLVVEVLSPSTRRKDQVLKLRLYERAVVPEYWLVDPDLTTVTVYRRTDSPSAIYAPAIDLSADNDDILETPQLPGWSLPLSKLRL